MNMEKSARPVGRRERILLILVTSWSTLRSSKSTQTSHTSEASGASGDVTSVKGVLDRR